MFSHAVTQNRSTIYGPWVPPPDKSFQAIVCSSLNQAEQRQTKFCESPYRRLIATTRDLSHYSSTVTYTVDASQTIMITRSAFKVRWLYQCPSWWIHTESPVDIFWVVGRPHPISPSGWSVKDHIMVPRIPSFKAISVMIWWVWTCLGSLTLV